MSVQRWPRRALAAAVATTIMIGATTGAADARRRVSAPPPPPRATVVLYGDSVAMESRGLLTFFLGLSGKVGRVESRTYGGTAPCDWIDTARQDAAEVRPDVVVLLFTGNAISPCMRDANGAALTGDAFFAAYRNDVQAIIDAFPPTTRVVITGSPRSRSQQAAIDAGNPDGSTSERLNDQYALQAFTNVLLGRTTWYADPRPFFYDASGRYSDAAPCLFFETCDASGVVPVRAPDGAHLCPQLEDGFGLKALPDCAVPASGVLRMSLVMFSRALEAAGG